MAKLDLASILPRTTWLSGTPDAFRSAIIEACQVRSLSTGQWLYGAEDEIGGPFVVLSGAMAMDAPSSSGSSELAWVVQPGHWAGAASVLGDRPRLFGIRALVDSSVAVLSAAAARRIAANDPSAWRWFGQMATRNGDRAVMTAVTLMIADGAARIASIIGLLSGSGFTDGERVPIPLSKAELARICGLSRGPMAVQLDHLERCGAIRTGYRRVEVVDTAILQTIGAGKIP